MFYRSGWLRCVGLKCMRIGLSFWKIIDVRAGLTLGVRLFLLLLLYYILYSYIPSFSSSLHILLFPIFCSIFISLSQSFTILFRSISSSSSIYLLFSSSDLSFFSPLPLLFLQSSHSPLSFKVYVSVLTYGYLYSRLMQE